MGSEPSSDPRPVYEIEGKRIWIAGHTGMVGSAVSKRLAPENCEILTVARAELDLRRQAEVEAWLAENRPDAVILAAGTVGGILANETRPAEFIYDNTAIETNIIHGAWEAGVERLLFLGSACIYPREAPQPMAEEALLTGPLEPTNQWYAISKIAGIKMCQAYRRQYGADFISAQPNNLYGPGDNFDPLSSHVVPALLVKAHRAKTEGGEALEIWGTGEPRREFLYVDDLADALVHLLRFYSDEVQINIGTGEEVTIRELALAVRRAVGFTGPLRFDEARPDGAPRKLLAVERMTALGWAPETTLEEGLAATYEWYLANLA